MSRFRTAYGPRFVVSQSFDPETSRVASEFREECDVNVILKKYATTGVVSSVNRRSPMYGDFSSVPSSLLEASLMVNEARDSFAALPSSVRKRFGNDPMAFVEFCSDEANRDEAISLGLVLAPEPSVEAKNDFGDGSATTPAAKSSKASGGQKNPPSVDE